MASNGNSKGGLLTAGGILSIVGGVFELIAGGLMASFIFLGVSCWLPLFNHQGVWTWREHSWAVVPIWPMVLGGILVVLGIIAIVGGISALRRKSFGLSLAGAICALPSVPLGILAVIFVALGKREFGAERKENGI